MKRACQAHDYRKKDFVFRLHLRDGSEYLFAAEDEVKMNEWINKLQFHAALPPNLQLMSYKEGLEQAGAAYSNGSGNDNERTLEYARTLSRNTPSPSGAAQGPPVPKPRQQRALSPQEDTNGNSRSKTFTVPEEEPSVEIRRGSSTLSYARSESFHGEHDNGHNERGVDVDVRARATSSLALGSNGKKMMRGATLPAGTTSGTKSPEFSVTDSGKASEKRGSKTSLIGNLFKKKDRHDK